MFRLDSSQSKFSSKSSRRVLPEAYWLESSMVVSSTQKHQLASWKRYLGISIALFGWLLHAALAIHPRQEPYAGIDFRAIYGSGRCIVAGCDPFSASETMAEFLKQGGTLQEAIPSSEGPFAPNIAGYPPTFLVYLTPISVLRWPLALYAWLAFSILIYGCAVVLIADLCADYSPLSANLCIAFFLAPNGPIALMVANPSVPAIGLCCVGLWCILKRRYELAGVLLFSLSLVIKPHIGYALVLYLLLIKAYRTRALQIIGTTIGMCIPPLLWVSTQPNMKNWYREYAMNLNAISMPGRLSNPGPTNHDATNIADLQAVISVFRDDRAFYNHVAWAISLVLLVVWVTLVRRLQDGRAKDLICIASVCAFSLLPFYHRSGDTLLLLLTFPALAFLISQSKIGRTSILMTLSISLAVTYTHLLGHRYLIHIPKFLFGSIWNGHLYTVLIERQVSLACLLACLFYLGMMYKLLHGDFTSPQQQRATDNGAPQHILEHDWI